MDCREVLPFKVGQLAESRSFKKGFRGAWFRCKIKNTLKREYSLDFYDFPEEKVRWTRLYQKPIKGIETKLELMLRPQYPPLYYENEMPDINTISEEIVVKNDVWKVGDEVDWFADGCYWSGRITKILTKEEVQFVLPPPPAGEGLTYEVSCKDLRPSLDWSLKNGWSVPIPKGGENLHPCARLIKPAEQGPRISEINDVNEMGKGFQLIAGSPFGSTFSSDTSSSSSIYLDKPQQVIQIRNDITKTNCSNSVSTSQIRDDSPRYNGDEDDSSSGPKKRMRFGADFLLNSTKFDTLEATFLDLEELVNKVKWLKGILLCENLSKARRPPWKFLAHQASSTPK